VLEYKVQHFPTGIPGTLESHLNEMAARKWRLHTIAGLEMGRSITLVFEREAGIPFEDLPIPSIEPASSLSPIVEIPALAQVEESPPLPEPPKVDPNAVLYEEGWMENETGGWQDPEATDDQLVKSPYGRYSREDALRLIGQRNLGADRNQ